jgi:hypothetical protein
VALRVAILLAVAGAGVLAWVFARRGTSSTDREALYVCPMHPEVTSGRPDECPICFMALVPRSKAGTTASSEESNAIGLKASEARRLTDYSRFSHIGTARKHVQDREIVAPAWFDGEGFAFALLYKDEIASLAPDEAGVFRATGAPEVGIEARRTEEAAVAWDRSLSTLRFRLVRPPPPGSGLQGSLAFARKPRTALVISSTAVLESAEGPYVLLYSVAEKRYVKRAVEVGRVFGDLTTIVAGLRERETVVEMNTFYMDAERRLAVESDVGQGLAP